MNYNSFFDGRRGYYRARFWDNAGYDTYAKVPDAYWRELGYATPAAADPRFDKMAAHWTMKEADRRAAALREGAAGAVARKLDLRATWELYVRENPRQVSADTTERNAVSFAALARTEIDYQGERVSVADLYPEQIDEPVIVRYRNARLRSKVINAGAGAEKAFEVDRAPRHRTINNETDLLQRLVRFAWKWRTQTGMEIIRLEDDIARLPEQDSTQVALTEEQAGELLRVLPERARWQAIFGICSRLREENLFGLRGEWVSWPESWLVIPAAFMKKGRSQTARDLSIPLPAIAVEQLGAPRLAGYVWPNPETGLPFTRITNLAGYCTKAGVPEISEHDLRTTGATWLKNHGVHHLTIKALMGHSTRTGDVTDLYTKVMREEMVKAVAIYDEIFAKILRPALKVVPMEARG